MSDREDELLTDLRELVRKYSDDHTNVADDMIAEFVGDNADKIEVYKARVHKRVNEIYGGLGEYSAKEHQEAIDLAIDAVLKQPINREFDSVCAASVYISQLRGNRNFSMAEIEDVADVSSVTIRKCYRDIAEYAFNKPTEKIEEIGDEEL